MPYTQKQLPPEIVNAKLELIGKILENDDKRLLQIIGAVMDAYLED